VPKRIHYIDWLRVLAVLALFPYHSARIFDTFEPFYTKSAATSAALSWGVISFLNLFHMPLLFLLAGASMYFALAKRSGGTFTKERLLRLGVPLLFGVLVVVPPQSWAGATANGANAKGLLAYWPTALTFSPAGDLSGYAGYFTPGHLWFILFLLLLSLAALPLVAWWRKDTGAARLTRFADRFATPLGVAIIVVPLLLADALPEIGGKNPVYFLVYLLAGAVFVSDPRWAEVAERKRFWYLAIGLVGAVATSMLWGWRAGVPDISLPAAAFAVLRLGSGWALVLACLGFGRRFLDRTGPPLSYLAEASYPVYILHQTVIVLAGAWLLSVLPRGVWLPYVAILVSSVVVTYAAYEVVRRVPALRFLFGMRPKPKAVAAD
jgi:glucan biosynthesis protein C